HSAVAEAFRSLRTSVTFMAVGGQPLAADDRVGVVLVTSPSPSEGKTTVSVNLAAAFAETGRSVVVVNADFRRPSITTVLLDDGPRPSLPAALSGIDRLDPDAFLLPTKVAGVSLLDLAPLGASPGDLTRATVRLVSALSERIDVLIIDTPPLVVTTEALEFVPDAKVVVLVGRLGRTTTASAQRAGELARFGGAEQIAVALSDTGRGGVRRTRYYDYYETPQAKPKGSRRLGRKRRGGDEQLDTAVTNPDSRDVDDRVDQHDDAGEHSDRSGSDDWRDADELIDRNR
ncbi:MAG: CpsD/CapB family tyrosine-protein kinase, partial [Actinomycetota bacterium]|nr:CpsD/CapB family tyrosine-protein kinase [Actinomycetota bacterium]